MEDYKDLVDSIRAKKKAVTDPQEAPIDALEDADLETIEDFAEDPPETPGPSEADKLKARLRAILGDT